MSGRVLEEKALLYIHFCLFLSVGLYSRISCVLSLYLFPCTFALSLRLSISILSMSIHMRFLSSFACSVFDLDLPFHGFTFFPMAFQGMHVFQVLFLYCDPSLLSHCLL